MGCLLKNVAFVGAFIASISGTFPSAGTTSYVIISVKTQVLDQGKVKDTSQLINGISDVLQKLVRCFNDTTNSTFFVSLLTAIFAIILLFYLKDSELVVGSALWLSLGGLVGSSL